MENDTPKPEFRKPNTSLRFRTASSGCWAAFLLPAAIYFSDIKFHGQSFTAVSIILFNTALLTAFQLMNYNLTILLSKVKKLNIVLAAGTILYCISLGGNPYEYASYVAINFTFPYVFCNIIKYFPRCFTFAEGIIATSAFVYNFWVASQNLPFPPRDLTNVPEPIVVSIFLQIVFFVSILLGRFVLLAVKPWKLFRLEECFCIWAKCCLSAFGIRLLNPSFDIWFLLQWPFQFLFADGKRIVILVYWAFCLLVAIGVLFWKNYRGIQATTIDRKYFHFLIVAVYVPGILKDFDLIYFCSAVLMYLCLVLEFARSMRFTLFGFSLENALEDFVKIFRDQKDEGKLILTTIYLLGGLSLPIWLTGLYYKNSHILTAEETAAALVGVFSIGIGDTFASIGGTVYGRTKWPGSNKTLEGTFCSIIAQVLIMLLILLSGMSPYTVTSIVGQLIAIVINALVEAKTDQIDNLIVPLVAFNVIHIVKIIF